MEDHPQPPIFSIITVTRDNLDGLKATRASLAAQTCHDFEWIIIDGDSHDGTKDYLSQATLDHAPSSSLSEPDTGIYDAMNKGIRRANGVYLLFLNAGDSLATPQTLEKLASAAIRRPDFIYGDALEYFGKKTGTPEYKHARPAKKVTWGMFTHHQSMLYKNEIIRQNRLRYRQIYSIAGDYDFTLRFLMHAKRALYTPIPVCIFAAGGISQTNAFEGRRQQYIIRETLDLVPQPFNLLILMVQSVIWRVRKHAPFLYRLLKTKSQTKPAEKPKTKK